MSRTKAPMIQVKPVPEMGRGLFATRNIKKGTVIEKSPTIRLTPGDNSYIENTVLQFYTYDSPNELSGDCFLALGFGALFNHSDEPNVAYRVRPDEQDVLFKAGRNIKKGEQLFIDYGWFRD